MTKRIPADWRARYAADQPPLTEEEMTLPHLPWPPLSRRGMEDRMTQDTTTQGRATLYRKIAAVTAAVSRIPKNGENTFHRYKYATESDITDGLRDLLKENGLAFLPPSVVSWERDDTAENPKLGPRTRVQVQFGIACCDTGEVFTSMLWGEGQDTSDKGFYKAYTGAVKYFLMKTFLIATGDDPEHQDQPPQQRQAPQQRPTARQAPAQQGASYTPPPERSAPPGKPGDRHDRGGLAAGSRPAVMTGPDIGCADHPDRPAPVYIGDKAVCADCVAAMVKRNREQ